jgi:hypothetical protein
MPRKLHLSIPLSICAAGFAAFGACVDPFPLDTTPQPSGGSGGSVVGAGGGTATGGSAGSGGAAVVNTGGSVGLGGAAATGGSAGMGGAAGSGGSVTADASQGGSGGGAGGVSEGGVDGAAGAGGGIVTLPAPPIVDCPPDPPIPDGGSLTCPANLADIANWFPVTPPMDANGGCRPLPHPAGECLFYQHSWHEFLIATQPDAQGRPAFLSWNTVENTFGRSAGQPSPAVPVLVAGVTQAGGRQVVIDQNGRALYYGMHMNSAFVSFVRASNLTNANGILAADPNLTFPSTLAMVETKEAWMIVPGAVPNNFITTTAMVPTLSIDPVTNQVIADDANLRLVTVQLIAMHIVHTIGGHPEFIWSSFQHTNATTGVTDVAPSAPDLPITPPGTILSPLRHLLYAANTTVANSNRGVLTPLLNAAAQTFTTPPTSIYRVFPGSKSADSLIDDDVAATNDAFTTRFVTNPRPGALDRRPNYRLVGAIWQDVPDRTFTINKALVNDGFYPAGSAEAADILLNGSDSAFSITGGEERLSSTAMESFTQAGASFPNCFSCHDTQATSANGTPQVRSQLPQLMKPGKINISHIFNEVVRLNLN